MGRTCETCKVAAVCDIWDGFRRTVSRTREMHQAWFPDADTTLRGVQTEIGGVVGSRCELYTERA